MAGNLNIELADAVVAALQAGVAANAFGIVFEPCRAYRPRFDLDKDHGLKVTVVPKNDAQETLTRGFVDMRTLGVDVAVQMRVSLSNGEIDPLMELVDKIQHYLSAPVGKATWFSWTNEPIYWPDHIANHSVFTSVTTFNYKRQVKR
jgi:hypothetical protein